MEGREKRRWHAQGGRKGVSEKGIRAEGRTEENDKDEARRGEKEGKKERRREVIWQREGGYRGVKGEGKRVRMEKERKEREEEGLNNEREEES